MTRRPALVPSVILGFVLIAATALGAGARTAAAQTSAAPVRLPGHVLPALAGATKTTTTAAAQAGSPADQPLTLTIILNRTDQAGFDRYLQTVSARTGRGSHQFLTPAQQADQFGPSKDRYNAVLNWLTGQGFSVVEGSANRLTITVNGTRAQAQQAFGVHIDDYRIGNRAFHANDIDPAVPASIAPAVQAVIGLNDLARPHSNDTAADVTQDTIDFGKCLAENKGAVDHCLIDFAIGKAIPMVGSTVLKLPPSCVEFFLEALKGERITSGLKGMECAADELNVVNSYVSNLHPAGTSADRGATTATALSRPTGAGQTIGLLQFDSFNASDVADFVQFSGLPAATSGHVSEVKVNGGAAIGPDEQEVLLDIAVAISLAQDATVKVYDGPFAGRTSFQTMFNHMIGDGVNVISNSWSYCEDQSDLADAQSLDSVLASAAGAGISVFNASGDSGATCLDGSAGTVGLPASVPHATAVGGTAPRFGTGKQYESETYWGGAGATPPGGSGGFGVSRFFSRPAYQNGLTGATMRSVPDVTANADPLTTGILLCQADKGGCPDGLVVGGTSMSAPVWGALTTVLNQALGHSLGEVNPQIYPFANTAAFHTAASMGSDFAHAGLGTLNHDQLYLALRGQPAGPVDGTVSDLGAYRDQVPVDGQSVGRVVVVLMDAQGNTIPGKTVRLDASAGSHVTISPATVVTTTANGAATFIITPTTLETVTFTATDVTDNVTIPRGTTITFVSPPAVAGGISASPTSVAADGNAASTITVTLQDGSGNGVSGKVVNLSQGSGHSTVSGPVPATTDTNGQVKFTVRDTTPETVTYSAIDVTDNNVPIPGTAVVAFTGPGGGPCSNLPLPTAAAGYAYTTFVTAATGMWGDNLCRGPMGVAFDPAGNLYVANWIDGRLYKFGPSGGAANDAAHLPQGNYDCPLALAFSKSGTKLFLDYFPVCINAWATTAAINPATGGSAVSIAGGNTGLAVDPLSGDLFTTNGGSGGSVLRIANPESASPTVTTYVSNIGAPDGITFAPDGTIYVAAQNGHDNNTVYAVRVTGTNGPNPPQVTYLAPVPTGDGIAVIPNPSNPAAPTLLMNRNDGTLTKIDLTTNPPALSGVFTGGSRGDFVAVGPDGCIYATQSDRILRVTNADGSCPAAPTSPFPTLRLTPPSVSPSPAQGTAQTFTATFFNVTPPAGTNVTFTVGGANPQTKQVTIAADGTAAFTYTGVRTGEDQIVATATVNGTPLASNTASVTWTAGMHVTFLNLSLSPATGPANRAVTVKAVLTDISTNPSSVVGSASLHFTLAGQACDATTDPTGLGTCSLTPPGPAGNATLSASFAGDATRLSSTGSKTFSITEQVQTQTALTYTGDTALTNGSPAHLAATLKDSGGTPISAKSVSFTLGAGGGAQGCNGTTGNDGSAACTIAAVNQPVGPADPLTVSFAGDSQYAAATAQTAVAVADAAAPGMTLALNGGGQSGAAITVPPDTAVTAQAALTGLTATAGGTVTYTVVPNGTCASVRGTTTSVQPVTNGSVPASAPASFHNPGLYSWQAVYSGDARNPSLRSACSVETVAASPPPPPAGSAPACMIGDYDDDWGWSWTAPGGGPTGTVQPDAAAAAAARQSGGSGSGGAIAPVPAQHFPYDWSTGDAWLSARARTAGMKSVTVVSASNAQVTIVPFLPGTTHPVLLVVRRTAASQGVAVVLALTDMANATGRCTLVLTTPTQSGSQGRGAAANGTSTDAVSGLDGTQATLQVNGADGLAQVAVRIGNTTVTASPADDHKIWTADVSSALSPGSANSAAISAQGQAGLSAAVLFTSGSSGGR